MAATETTHKAWAAAIGGAVGAVLASLAAWLQVTDLSALSGREIAAGAAMAIVGGAAGWITTYYGPPNQPKGDAAGDAGADRP